MKYILLLCLFAFANANFLDTIAHGIVDTANKVEHGVVDAANTVGHGVVDAAHTVGHGVVDAAHTVGHGVVDAAHTVGHGVVDAAHTVGSALNSLGPTLGSTFGDIWNVVKDPLAQAGKEVLVHAAEFALEQGVTMALDSLAAGKRTVLDLDTAKALVGAQLTDEYRNWLQETENNIKGSRQEIESAIVNSGYSNLPQEMKNYLNRYASALLKGQTQTFVTDQANVALQNALTSLKRRLEQRVQTALKAIRNMQVPNCLKLSVIAVFRAINNKAIKTADAGKYIH